MSYEADFAAMLEKEILEPEYKRLVDIKEEKKKEEEEDE